MQITLTVTEATISHLKNLGVQSGETPEAVAGFLLNDIVLSAVADPELIGNADE